MEFRRVLIRSDFGEENEITEGYVKASAPKGGLPGGTITFPVVSVGATENALMAAVLAKGQCVMENAAREPEIVDLCNLLVAMGAQINGIGSDKLVIEGVERLHRSEEHTSELQSLMRISYAVFCLKKKKQTNT